MAPEGDWILLGADGWGGLDIRGQIRTGDGIVLYYRAEGVLEMNEAVQRYLAGTASTEFADHYARLYYRMEAGDDRLRLGEPHPVRRRDPPRRRR